MRRRAFIAFTLLGLIAILLPTPHAGAGTGHIQSWLAGQRGGMGTTFCGDLAGYAQRRANEMAAAQQLWHGSDLGSANQNWYAMGEIVGRGGDAPTITHAWQNSSGHRSKYMQARFVEAGVGVAHGADGLMYSSVVLRHPTHPCGSPPPAPPPPPVAAPAPAPAPGPAPAPRTRVRSSSARPAQPVAVAQPAAPPPPPELSARVSSVLSVTRHVSEELRPAVRPAPRKPAWF